LLIEELRRWTFAGEAVTNIGPDTPEKKSRCKDRLFHFLI